MLVGGVYITVHKSYGDRFDLLSAHSDRNSIETIGIEVFQNIADIVDAFGYLMSEVAGHQGFWPLPGRIKQASRQSTAFAYFQDVPKSLGRQ